MKSAPGRTVALLFAALWLHACGGGGGGDSGGGGGGNGPPTTRLSVSTTIVAASAIPGEEAPTFDVVATVANPPEALWANYTSTVNGIVGVTFESSSLSRADFHILFKSPAETPNGRYEDTLKIYVCLDAGCTRNVEGSPATVRIAYDITGGTRATPDRTEIVSETDGRSTESHQETVHLQYERPLPDSTYVTVTHTSRAVEGYYVHPVSPTQTDIELFYAPGSALSFGPHEDTIRVTACYDHTCSKKLLGSPYLIQSTHKVTIYPEAGYEELPVASRVPLGHDVVDAEFSRSLNAIVMASRKPANALYVYDVATGVERQQPLAQPPLAVSVSPDGRTAAVGHQATLTVIDLAQAGLPGAPAPLVLAVGTDAHDVVLDGAGKVHVFPKVAYDIIPHTVDIATGTDLEGIGWPALFPGARVGLSPNSSAIYEANTIYTPTGLTRWDVGTGLATRLYYFPNEYHGVYEVCGNLWFSNAGDRIYTACGNIFTTGAAQADDMHFVAALPITNTHPYLYSHVIRSLSADDARNEVAIVEVMNGCESPTFVGACYTHFALFDGTTLERKAIWAIQPVTVDDVIYPQLGYYVFHDATAPRKYLISRLQSMPNDADAFYLSVID